MRENYVKNTRVNDKFILKGWWQLKKKNKIKEDKRKEKEWYQGRMFGEMKM